MASQLQPRSWPLTWAHPLPGGGPTGPAARGQASLLGLVHPLAPPASGRCRPLPPPPPPTLSRLPRPGGIWGPPGLSPSSPSLSFLPTLTVSPRLPLGQASAIPAYPSRPYPHLYPCPASHFISLKCMCLSSLLKPNSSEDLKPLEFTQCLD